MQLEIYILFVIDKTAKINFNIVFSLYPDISIVSEEKNLFKIKTTSSRVEELKRKFGKIIKIEKVTKSQE